MKTTPVRRLTQAGVITVCVAALAACGTSSRSYNVSGAPGGDSAACSRLMDKAPQRVGATGARTPARRARPCGVTAT